MAIYAIGDVQGCFDDLKRLLEKIRFNSDDDYLWFVGDLVNRGPQSLEVLRYVRSLQDHAVTVLGNHDLHLLAVAAGIRQAHCKDTINSILEAPDCDELLKWLRGQPLLHHDTALGYTMIHAGLPPQWGLTMAQSCAHEVEATLRSSTYTDFLEHMYGNEPSCWSESLVGWERLRFIVNCLTRLRYCNPDGSLVLAEKGAPSEQLNEHMPWFNAPHRASVNMRIIFGHWSALGQYSQEGIYALDSGCLWGGTLTALRLDSNPEWYNVECAGACIP